VAGGNAQDGGSLPAEVLERERRTLPAAPGSCRREVFFAWLQRVVESPPGISGVDRLDDQRRSIGRDLQGRLRGQLEQVEDRPVDDQGVAVAVPREGLDQAAAPIMVLHCISIRITTARA
jgi:hypothetical protein